MLQDITVKVEKATYDFDQKLIDFVKQLNTALKDGWQPVQDLPVVLQAAMIDLIPALQELQAVKGEVNENLEGFLKAHIVSAFDLAKALGIL